MSATRDVIVDEGPRPDTSLERLAALRPVFAADGTVTAGNSSPLNDGAAALLLATEAGCERHDLEPLARVVTWASTGVEPRRMGIGPAPALRLALERAGWKLDELDVIELNEAFAAQALAVVAELGLDAARTNPRGGAIALGHPLGCSGARIATTLGSSTARSRCRKQGSGDDVHRCRPGHRHASSKQCETATTIRGLSHLPPIGRRCSGRSVGRDPNELKSELIRPTTSSSGGTNFASMSSIVARLAWTETLTAAMTVPASSRTGAATDRNPCSSSWSTIE